jgi:glycerol kinase
VTLSELPNLVVRAVVEGQFLARKMYCDRLGLVGGVSGARLVVTGGASANVGLMRILSDVFGVPVFGSSGGTSSASMGAAFRAAHGWYCGRGGDYVSVGEVVTQLSMDSADVLLGLALVATPNLDNTALYSARSATVYAELEATARDNNFAS